MLIERVAKQARHTIADFGWKLVSDDFIESVYNCSCAKLRKYLSNSSKVGAAILVNFILESSSTLYRPGYIVIELVYLNCLEIGFAKDAELQIVVEILLLHIDAYKLFCFFGRFRDRRRVWKGLMDRGVLIRETGPDQWLRVSVGTPQENARFIEVLDEVVVDSDLMSDGDGGST